MFLRGGGLAGGGAITKTTDKTTESRQKTENRKQKTEKRKFLQFWQGIL
jgi:hypothetical protein